MKKHLTLFNLARAIVAIILLQTLYFKFTGHPESVKLFTQIDMEPWGRIGTGIIELVVALLLVFGRKKHIWMGALVALVVMIGAVYFHIAYIGIDPLFWMAITIMICSVYILWRSRTCETGDC